MIFSNLSLKSAFLVVTKFEPLYREFAANPKCNSDIYALPVFGTNSDRLHVHYHGLDRNPLDAYDKEPALAAEIRMSELEQLKRCDGPYLFDSDDLADVLDWADQEKPGLYETVWARRANSKETPPRGFSSFGFEPSFFPQGYFSASCDCMCVSRWHGTDGAGELFAEYFHSLNRCG